MSELWNFILSIIGYDFFGNSLLDYAKALGYFLLSLIILFFLRKIILHRMKKAAEHTKTTWDDFIVKQIQDHVVPILYFGSFYLSIQGLAIHPNITFFLNAVAILLLNYNILRFLSSSVHRFLQQRETLSNGTQQRPAFKGLFPAINTLIWGTGVIFLMDNFGLDISSIVTGLGIGGVAVALAAQAILADVFSYFSIMIDKPFEIGDFIIVGDISGTIEHIGLKTTRVRSLSGEQVIFSNTDMTSSRIKNYKRMYERRVVFKISVVYETEYEKLVLIPAIVRKAVEELSDVRFDRTHFATLGNFSLDFEVVYFVLNADYNIYMDIHQSLNLSIIKSFGKEGIEFAYPTQVVVSRQGSSQPAPGAPPLD